MTPLVIIFIFVLVAVPAVRRGRIRKAVRADVERISATQDAAFSRRGIYLSELGDSLPSGNVVEGLMGDSTGWGVTIVSDSARGRVVRCGMYVGPESFRPDSSLEKPGVVGCW